MKFISFKRFWDRLIHKSQSASLHSAPSNAVPVITSADSNLPIRECIEILDPDSVQEYNPELIPVPPVKIDTILEEIVPEPEVVPEPPQDASIHVWAASSSMAAFLTIRPPLNGGSDVTIDQLLQSLKDIHVTANINNELLQEIVDQKKYPKNLLIAKGIQPVHGINGKIVDYFSRESEIQLKEDEKGTIDFKNLDIVREIDAEAIICDIIPPKPGVDGLDITGRILPAKKGITPRIPMGKNTHVTEDGEHLAATTGGHIVFEAEKFSIHEKLIINKNVDGSVGNLNFTGDIEIHGDVHHGFTVASTGNILVRGMVEAANLEAGGNITLQGGINGNINTSLRAKGDILSRFLENCTVYANGSIYCESILNSKVYCNKLVSATKGKGVIISSFISAHSVESKTIGTRANHMTTIELGQPFNLAQEEKEAKNCLKEVENTLEKMEKNIIYLASQTTLSPQKIEILKNLLEQAKIYKKRQVDLAQQINRLANEPPDVSGCCVQATLLNPPLKITIGGITRLIDETENLCNIYLSSEESDIVVGVM